jgi:hypothetical protein
VQPAAPGLPPAQVAALYDALALELEPAGAIEECWLNDVAQLTLRIEALRLVTHNFYVTRMMVLARDERFMLSTFGINEVEFLRECAGKRFDSALKLDDRGRECVSRLMGVAFAHNIEKFKMLEDTERALLRERDRIVAQFERRRRDKLMLTVRAADASTRPGLPPPGPRRRAD